MTTRKVPGGVCLSILALLGSACSDSLDVLDEGAAGGGNEDGVSGAPSGSGGSEQAGAGSGDPVGAAGTQEATGGVVEPPPNTGGAGAGTQQATGGVVEPPVAAIDDRPEAPDEPLPLDLGAPGWRDSEEPFCATHYGLEGPKFGVWASEQHVYALYQTWCDPLVLDATPVPCDHAGMQLAYNDGTGWRNLYETVRLASDQYPPEFVNLTGASWPYGDDLYMTVSTASGGRGDGMVQAVLYDDEFFVEPGLVTPDGSPIISSVEMSAASYRTALFTVGPEILYKLNENVLQKYSPVDGWLTLDYLPEPAVALWADADSIVVAGGHGLFVARADTAEFETMPALPAQPDTADWQNNAVWAFGPEDIWLGTSTGRLIHFDGTEYSLHDTGSVGPGAPWVLELWGQGGELFYITRTELGRVRDQAVETILTLPDGMSFDDVWGTSPTEVYVTLNDEAGAQYACGGGVVLWFDGTELHRF